jgi:CRISPR/Cas system-associated protein Cas10 (large subunit of type III CRISPR-Cas system)
MAQEIDFSKLDVFCHNDECGDPVPYANGARAKRRMNYLGDHGNFLREIFVAGGHNIEHVYQCPVCGRRRVFGEFGGELDQK